MANKNTVLTLSWIVMIATLLVLIVALNKFGILTGFATDEASANLTIDEALSVAFTDDLCNFGSGSVNDDPENPDQSAIVYTNGTASENTTGWTGCDGLALKNDGNVVADIDLSPTSGDTTATAFIGTGGAWAITTVSTGCTGTAAADGAWVDFDGGVNLCTNMSLGGTSTIDFKLTIPEDALPTNSSTVITATASTVV